MGCASDVGCLASDRGEGHVAKNWGSRRNGAATFPETGVFAPTSPFYNNGYCVRELQALVAPKPPQGVLVRGQAGLVINKISVEGKHGGAQGVFDRKHPRHQ